MNAVQKEQTSNSFKPQNAVIISGDAEEVSKLYKVLSPKYINEFPAVNRYGLDIPLSLSGQTWQKKEITQKHIDSLFFQAKTAFQNFNFSQTHVILEDIRKKLFLFDHPAIHIYFTRYLFEKINTNNASEKENKQEDLVLLYRLLPKNSPLLNPQTCSPTLLKQLKTVEQNEIKRRPGGLSISLKEKEDKSLILLIDGKKANKNSGHRLLNSGPHLLHFRNSMGEHQLLNIHIDPNQIRSIHVLISKIPSEIKHRRLQKILLNTRLETDDIETTKKNAHFLLNLADNNQHLYILQTKQILYYSQKDQKLTSIYIGQQEKESRHQIIKNKLIETIKSKQSIQLIIEKDSMIPHQKDDDIAFIENPFLWASISALTVTALGASALGLYYFINQNQSETVKPAVPEKPIVITCCGF